MKFKTTAIAMAVAGVVAAPVAVQAGADEVYASARVGVEYQDTGGTADTNIRSVSSRFGARGETDLGNGLTGFGRYEWGVDFNDSDGDLEGDGSISTRHRFVGLKGDFGSALVGQTYHTFYNFAVGATDVPWVASGDNQVAYVGRTDDALTYAGSSDAFAFGATAYMVRDTDEEIVNVGEFGASYTFGNDMVLGGSIQATAGDWDANAADIEGVMIGNGSDETVFGVMLSSISAGDFGMGFGAQSQDDDYSIIANVGYNSFNFHIEYEHLDEDSDANTGATDDFEPIEYVIGYNQSLGRKTTLWYEAAYADNDDNCASNDSDCDNTRIYVVLKYDII
jgi:predicted porin